MKNPHVSEVWVNFTTQLGLFIKVWAENTFSHVAETYRLNRGENLSGSEVTE